LQGRHPQHAHGSAAPDRISRAPKLEAYPRSVQVPGPHLLRHWRSSTPLPAPWEVSLHGHGPLHKHMDMQTHLQHSQSLRVVCLMGMYDRMYARTVMPSHTAAEVREPNEHLSMPNERSHITPGPPRPQTLPPLPRPTSVRRGDRARSVWPPPPARGGRMPRHRRRRTHPGAWPSPWPAGRPRA